VTTRQAGGDQGVRSWCLIGEWKKYSTEQAVVAGSQRSVADLSLRQVIADRLLEVTISL